jgi:hypothetical protein
MKKEVHMLKKILFILTVALLAGGAYARDYVTPEGDKVDWEYDGKNSERKGESYSWPAEYKYVDICIIPIKMDVGFWVKVENCKDLVIKLKQDHITEYSGCKKVKVFSNVSVEFTYSIKKLGAEGIDALVPGNYSATITPSILEDPAPGGKEIEICVKLKDANLTKVLGGQNNLKVAELTLKVRPNVVPALAS